MIRIFLAKAFRVLFKIPFFKRRFFGFHKKIIAPFNLFKGVVQQVKFQRSFQLELHIDDWIQENIYFVDEYEKAEFKAVENLLENGGVFVDIGANIGLYTLHASNLIGIEGYIVCFEPFSKNYNSLKKNISLNEHFNLTAEKLAIGETNSQLEIYYNESEKNLGMVSSNLSTYTRSEKVTCVSLDSYLQNSALPTIDFIKIDIEGNEYAALLGMKNTLTKFQPTLLIEILKENESDKSDNEAQINKYLQGLGYEKYFIDDNGELSSVEKNPQRCNYIFRKKNS